MLATISLILSLGLTAYIVRDCARSPALYRRLKQAITGGDVEARTRFYRQIVRFELASASLAIAAVYTGGGTFAPEPLQLGDLGPVRFLADRLDVILVGLGIGLVVGAAAMALGARRAKGGQESNDPPRRRSMLPDVAALLPETRGERLRFALVALSAGVCEEIVFRGWLLAFLHGTVGLDRGLLIAIGAIAFGLAHTYQGVAGVLGTGFLGLIFIVLYVASGSLFLPIVVHTAVDLRLVFLPVRRVSGPPSS